MLAARHQCSLSLAGASTTGLNELRQLRHYRALAEREVFAANRSASLKLQQRHTYDVSQFRDSNGGCLQFDILQKNGAGGSSFRVTIVGATLELCLILDANNGAYNVSCPMALDEAGCALVDVRLVFEDYEAFDNRVAGGGPVGGPLSGGPRLLMNNKLLHQKWCQKPSSIVAEEYNVAHLARNRARQLQAASTMMSCESAGVWARTPANSSRPWWETHWHWVNSCHPHALRAAETNEAAEAEVFHNHVFRAASSIHFVGESHLLCTVDCFAITLEAQKLLVPARWLSLHRLEPISEDQPNDGFFAERAKPNSTFEWTSCGHRPASCWPVFNATMKSYNHHPNVGAETFSKLCWKWMPSAPTRVPTVCKHMAEGLFRVAMILRLMVADRVASAKPMGSNDVLVLQGGTWDSMAERSVDDHLEYDIPAFISALKAFRDSEFTKHARIIYITLPAVGAFHVTTGFRNTWAHAAANAMVLEALDAAALNVSIVDYLTWPRGTAAPDGAHFLRRRFSSPTWNRPPSWADWTTPPPGALCIGDAGIEMARALRDVIEDAHVGHIERRVPSAFQGIQR